MSLVFDSNTKMRYLILFFCYIKSEITSLKPDIPSQIHLSYHDIRTRSISWVTFQKSPVGFSVGIICENCEYQKFFKQYLFLKERNIGRFKRSLVYRSNEKVFEGNSVFGRVNFLLILLLSFDRNLSRT